MHLLGGNADMVLRAQRLGRSGAPGSLRAPRPGRARRRGGAQRWRRPHRQTAAPPAGRPAQPLWTPHTHWPAGPPPEIQCHFLLFSLTQSKQSINTHLCLNLYGGEPSVLCRTLWTIWSTVRETEMRCNRTMQLSEMQPNNVTDCTRCPTSFGGCISKARRMAPLACPECTPLSASGIRLSRRLPPAACQT